MPSTPITDLIKQLSSICSIDFHQACFEVKAYVKRNNYAHSGIDELITTEDWTELATVITRDQEAIERGILPEGMNDFKPEMLKTIKMFRDRYFSQINTTVNPETGFRRVLHCYLSDEQIKRQEAAKAAKLAMEVERLQKAVCDATVNRAILARPESFYLRDAQKILIKSKKDMDKKMEICKQAQNEAGKATRAFKEAVLACGKLEEDV
jgi:hypothetical protein